MFRLGFARGTEKKTNQISLQTIFYVCEKLHRYPFRRFRTNIHQSSKYIYDISIKYKYSTMNKPNYKNSHNKFKLIKSSIYTKKYKVRLTHPSFEKVNQGHQKTIRHTYIKH